MSMAASRPARRSALGGVWRYSTIWGSMPRSRSRASALRELLQAGLWKMVTCMRSMIKTPACAGHAGRTGPDAEKAGGRPDAVGRAAHGAGRPPGAARSAGALALELLAAAADGVAG